MNHGFQNKIIAPFVCAFFILFSAGCNARPAGQGSAAAIPAENSAYDGSLGAVDATLRDAVQNGTVAGDSLLLMQNGEVIYKQAYGNIGVNEAVKIASSSKPVATVGILMLVDEGKLSLDDTIGSRLPEFRGTKVENATLRQLLSHTAGVKGKYPGGRPSKGTLSEFSELIAEDGTLGSPGPFSYSGVSIDIACRMAETAAGIPIEEYFKSRLWMPLGMTNTHFDLAADPASVSSAERARGEGRYVSCGGGMKSTLDDMGIFYQMLLQQGVYDGKRYLSNQSYQEMIEKQAENPRMEDDPYTTGQYGLGLYRDRVAPDGAPLTISHGGAFGTMPWADLDTGLVGVFFSQTRLNNVKPLIAELQAEARSQEGFAPAQPDNAGNSGQSQAEQGFNRISGGAEVITYAQFQEFIETRARGDRLKGNPRRTQRVFQRLDENDDGVLSFEEFQEIQNLKR